MAADVLLPRTPWPRGCLIGLAAAVKLTPALFVLYLWWSGQRRTAVTAAVTSLGVTAAAWAVLPAESLTYWGSALWETGRVGDTDDPRNRSLWGLLLGSDLPRPLAVGLLLLTGALLTWVGLRRAVALDRSGRRAAAVVVTGCLTCLLSPVTWSHHVVWLAPAAVLLLLHADWRARALLLAVVGAATGLAPLAAVGVRPAAAQAVIVVLVVLGLTDPEPPVAVAAPAEAPTDELRDR